MPLAKVGIDANAFIRANTSYFALLDAIESAQWLPFNGICSVAAEFFQARPRDHGITHGTAEAIRSLTMSPIISAGKLLHQRPA